MLRNSIDVCCFNNLQNGTFLFEHSFIVDVLWLNKKKLLMSFNIEILEFIFWLFVNKKNKEKLGECENKCSITLKLRSSLGIFILVLKIKKQFNFFV